jgi:Uncharacterised nucleotidyltransferase
VPLRDLFLDTLAREPRRDDLARRWQTLRIPARVFVRLLRLEDCASDLFVRLDQLGLRDSVPPAVLSVLQRRAWRERAHMLAVRHEMNALVGAFQEHGVTVTLLKGAAFLYTGLRPYRGCRDVDILPAAGDLDAVLELLAALGYGPRAGDDREPDHRHLPPLYGTTDIPVEVHTRIFQRATPEGQDWCRTREVAPNIHVLAPTDWFWHAVAHDAVRPTSFGRVQGALDAAALVDRYGPEIDWSTIGARALLWWDPVEPHLASVKRLGYDIPVSVSRRVAVLTASLGRARDALAYVGPRDFIYERGVSKLGSIAVRLLRAGRGFSE